MPTDNLTPIFLSLRSRLHSLAASILRSNDEADDVLQDVFVRLWHSGDSDNGNVPGRLIVAVRNGCIDRLRRRSHIAETSTDDQHTVGIIDPRNQTEAREDIERILKFVRNEVPAQAATAFEMYVVDDLDYTEIAEKLNISVELARTYVSRTRKRIRNHFTDLS